MYCSCRSIFVATIFRGSQEYRRSKRPAILTLPFPKWPPPFFRLTCVLNIPSGGHVWHWHAHEGHSQRIFQIISVGKGGEANREVWASQDMFARLLQFQQTLLEFGLMGYPSLLLRNTFLHDHTTLITICVCHMLSTRINRQPQANLFFTRSGICCTQQHKVGHQTPSQCLPTKRHPIHLPS